ncbi:MAG: nuclear transport factor 2 family protein [Casimicrobiaceae bacterium]
MRLIFAMLAAVATLLSGCAVLTPGADNTVLTKQVADTERGFAKSMADRNFAAFQSYLADEAVFFTRASALRGKQAISDFWKRLYEKPDAPFSWEPTTVEVLDSGTLALSSGPVRDPSGKHFANFSSIWRLQSPGVWKIIFDKGNDECDCAKPQ